MAVSFFRSLVLLYLFLLFSVEARADLCFSPADAQGAYERADAIILVEKQQGILKVLRSWKTQLPKHAVIFTSSDSKGLSGKGFIFNYSIEEGTRHILFLRRDRKNPEAFRTTSCSWNIHSGEKRYHEMLQWLDLLVSCGCLQGEPYERADAIIHARVLRRFTQEFAEVEVLHSWKSEMPKNFMVQTADHRPECGYPIQQGKTYLLHLKRRPSGFLTNICSGNPEQGNIYNLIRKYEYRLRISCGCSKSKNGVYSDADSVIHAKVRRRIVKGAQEFAEVEVLDSWKSEVPKILTVQTSAPRPECGYPVQEGETHLLHLKRGQTGFSTNICSENPLPHELNHLINVYNRTEIW
jgi:hypothetical protein